MQTTRAALTSISFARMDKHIDAGT
jgi:hypothetical protein